MKIKPKYTLYSVIHSFRLFL